MENLEIENFSGTHQLNPLHCVPEPGFVSRPNFVPQPMLQDYHALAQHVTAAPQSTLHSALWPQREQVAQRLQQMAEQPEKEAHQAAYQALRLLVW